MLLQQNNLELTRCPDCAIAKPRLDRVWQFSSANHSGGRKRYWVAYKCSSCGGITLTWAHGASDGVVVQIMPEAMRVNDSIPERARYFLSNAIDTKHAPPGAILLAASSVDSMLKAKGYKEGSLYNRIKLAVENHLITPEMAEWANEVRLDANDQRHGDEHAALPTEIDAEKVIEFALALGEYMFVLPEKVKLGRSAGTVVINK